MWISFGREKATDIWTGVEHRNYGVQTKSKPNDLGRADGKPRKTTGVPVSTQLVRSFFI
jgi:hypothetical protein